MAFLTKKKRSSSFNKQENNVDLKEHEEQIEKEPNFVKASETKVEGIDFVSPSLIKETLPSDLLGDGTKINDYYVEVGGTTEFARYFRSFFAEITGGSTYAGMLDPLLIGEFGQGDVDVALHVDPVETTEELEDIARRIRGIKSDMYREMPDEKRDKLRDELEDLVDRQRRLRQNLEKPFRVSMQIVASATELKTLKRFANNMIRRFSGNDIILRSPDGKQLDALLNITPLADSPFYKEHTFSYETSNVADFFPFGNGKVSHKTGIIWGRDHLGRPIFYDAWDRSLMNRNAVVTGGSGAGKTFSVLRLIHHDTLRGIRHCIICPKGDYRRYIVEMGCPYIDLGPESPYRINFFDVDVEERLINNETIKQVNIENTIIAARAIIYRMIKILDEDSLTGIVKVRIDNKIRELYREKEITSDPESLYIKEKEAITGENGKPFFSMKRKMKDMPQIGELYMKLKEDSDTKTVAELLKNFTIYGDAPTQSIFDTQSTVKITDTPLFGFGLAELDEEIMKPLGLFIATKWLSTKFSHKDRHIRKRVVVDEAQIPMQDNETAQWLENEFRVVRFFNTSMIAITQGFEVFTRSEFGLGILKNAPTKLFLKQDSIDINEIQGKFNLTEYEADFLVSEAGEGLGILRINEERSIIQVSSSLYEAMLFETNPDRIREKSDMYARSRR
ncbi:VirB4 family type IV secretion system protein [Psychrobacillus sp. FSL H8-0487]|uniref:VirB4 family type IV secretion system protein n=1 Tax=Psychrobacillus sp. FSL H8-0487 TaxID=2921391 RepID=UPI0030FB6781